MLPDRKPQPNGVPTGGASHRWRSSLDGDRSLCLSLDGISTKKGVCSWTSEGPRILFFFGGNSSYLSYPSVPLPPATVYQTFTVWCRLSLAHCFVYYCFAICRTYCGTTQLSVVESWWCGHTHTKHWRMRLPTAAAGTTEKCCCCCCRSMLLIFNFAPNLHRG